MFQKAQRTKIKLRLAVTGPSGSGKTYSALRLASGIGKKIAVFDTENCSASLYSEKFNFDVMEINPPFATEKYIDAIRFAEKEKYDVLILDSISHAWAMQGGLLEQKEKLDARGGNSYTNWGSITKKDNEFRAAWLNSNLHIICTMRSKTDYVMELNEKGKMAPKKVGLAPIQRDGIEYEFTTVFDIALNHEAQVSKDRTGLFTDQIFKVTEETGEKINTWLSSGYEREKSLSNEEILNIIEKTNHIKNVDELSKIWETYAEKIKALPEKDKWPIIDHIKHIKEKLAEAKNEVPQEQSSPPS